MAIPLGGYAILIVLAPLLPLDTAVGGAELKMLLLPVLPPNRPGMLATEPWLPRRNAGAVLAPLTVTAGSGTARGGREVTGLAGDAAPRVA